MGHVSAATSISEFDKKVQKVIKKDVNPKVKPAPFLHAHLLEAGVDEAGRGCLAGPVFAAAVILPKDFENEKNHDIFSCFSLPEGRARFLFDDSLLQ